MVAQMGDAGVIKIAIDFSIPLEFNIYTNSIAPEKVSTIDDFLKGMDFDNSLEMIGITEISKEEFYTFV